MFIHLVRLQNSSGNTKCTGTPLQRLFSLYLRAAKLDKGISCTVQYAFSIVNMKNLKATVRHESPPEGRKFEEKNEKLSWGWKEFARKDRICEKDRGKVVNYIHISICRSKFGCYMIENC